MNPFDIESSVQNTQTKEKSEVQKSEKNYTRTLITFSAILVTVGILVLLTFVLISSARDLPARDIKPTISLTEILNSSYVPNKFNGTWISDEEIQYLKDGDVVNFNVTDSSSLTILKGTEFFIALNISKSKIFQASTSADKSFILIGHSISAVFGGPLVAKFEIYDIYRKTFTAVLPNASNPDADARLLQGVSWAPVGNALSFIHEHDIYYMANASDATSVRRITADGSVILSNGMADAFSGDYEDADEEKFGSDAKIFWSPEGTRLGFLEYNVASVKKAKISWYGEPGDFETFQYTYQSEAPYAKPGRTNPAVSVVTVSLGEDKFDMTYQKSDIYPGVPADHLISEVEWISESEFIVEILSRNQNESFALVCNVTGICTNVLTVRLPNGWLRWDQGTTIKTNGTALVTLTSQKQSSGLAYHHILWVSMTAGQASNRSLTSGDFSIDDMIGWDEDRHRVYFTAPLYDFVTNNSEPSQTHLYYVSDEDKGSIPTCVTCPLKNSQNESCLFNEVSFSSDYTYFAHTCAGTYSVPEVTIRGIDNNVERVWESNSAIQKKLATVELPTMKNFDIPISNNFTAKARLWLPPNFDSTRKYPLIVYVYGGPESQEVKDGFEMDWRHHVVVARDIIYAAIDGRGSGRQSDDLMFQVYRKLGSVEVEDQIEATKWLIDTTEFIDPKRTAIWGWSYGGYATAMVLAKDKGNVFQTGISVAPVTSWMLYRSVYAERYMGYPTPEDNLKGYNASDVSSYVENFSGKNFYLIHGNADENVHYQESMVLARALEKADIMFRSQSYPDEGHSLGGVRPHLYHSIEKFLFDDIWK